MIQSDSILNAVFSLYAERKAKAEEVAYKINNALEKNQPYTNLRYQIKGLSLEICKAEFEQNEELANKLKQEREEKKQQLKQLLLALNLTENSLKPNYVCKKCNDSAHLQDGSLCSCFFETLATVTQGILGLNEINLPTFDDYIANDKDSKKLKSLFLSYVEKFPPETVKNLIFLGSTGTGKTFSAGCIASAIKSANNTVIYLSATKLGEVFLRYHTASFGDKRAIYDLLTNCDLLVIDDLGTEPVYKNVTTEYLTAFLSERLSGGKPFIITTNLELEEIKTRYNDRVLSRLSGKESAIIKFTGKDLRRKN
ncbi:MAG: ATP-binding protein [Clostridia bacterium]|nr:ATP-binding protein [Clostridia bacterium]